jgi:hypothetical protein
MASSGYIVRKHGVAVVRATHIVTGSHPPRCAQIFQVSALLAPDLDATTTLGGEGAQGVNNPYIDRRNRDPLPRPYNPSTYTPTSPSTYPQLRPARPLTDHSIDLLPPTSGRPNPSSPFPFDLDREPPTHGASPVHQIRGISLGYVWPWPVSCWWSWRRQGRMSRVSYVGEQADGDWMDVHNLMRKSRA